MSGCVSARGTGRGARDHGRHRGTASGFALLAVLWLVTLVGGVLAIGLAAARLGQHTTRNRVALARGRWAAEACVAILQGRWVSGREADSATIDLGRTTTCSWRIDDPGARLHVHHAARDELLRLQAVLGVPPDSARRFTGAVIARRKHRPMFDAAELAVLSAFDQRVAAYLTVDGPGAVSALRAPRPVLLALPGMTPEAVDRLLARRSTARPIRSLDELGGALSPPARDVLYANYAFLVSALTFEPKQLVVRAEGWVGPSGTGPRAAIELLAVPLPERLAVVRRVVIQ